MLIGILNILYLLLNKIKFNFVNCHFNQYIINSVKFNSTRIDDGDCVYTANSQHRCQPKVNYRQKEKEVLDQILGPGSYDARIRPSGVNGTGKIRFNII